MKPRFSSGGRDISFHDTLDDLGSPCSDYLIQEAVDFDKLLRVVYMDGEVVDAVYDRPTARFEVKNKLGQNSKVYSENRDELEGLCKRLSRAFDMEPLVVDLFEKDGEFYFNEINAATNLYWLRYRSKVPHASRLAQFLMAKISH